MTTNTKDTVGATTEQQLETAKGLLAEILGRSLGSAEGYLPSLGHPLTRKIQRQLVELGVTEIVYQPGTWIEQKGPVLPPAGR